MLSCVVIYHLVPEFSGMQSDLEIIYSILHDGEFIHNMVHMCYTHGGTPLLRPLPPRFLLDRANGCRPPFFFCFHDTIPFLALSHRASLLPPRPAGPSGPLRRTVPHCLLLLVLGFELPLDIEVGLALALDALLLHVTDHALVHCLVVGVVSYLGYTRYIRVVGRDEANEPVALPFAGSARIPLCSRQRARCPAGSSWRRGTWWAM